MLRIVKPSTITDAGQLERFRGLLTDGERSRIDRFVFAHDRHVRLVARASLRLCLAEHTGAGAAEFQFRENAYGKPFVELPEQYRHVCFNVSHTKDCVAILICDHRTVGVDVEEIRPMSDLHSIAQRFFAQRETEALAALSGQSATERFFQYWTLKESYIKGRGMGLSLPLDQFWFDVEAGPNPPRIHFLDGIDDDPNRWIFHQQRLDAGHWLATAIENPQGAK
jgi:4'-phosphopantetheinyl transferase